MGQLLWSFEDLDDLCVERYDFFYFCKIDGQPFKSVTIFEYIFIYFFNRKLQCCPL